MSHASVNREALDVFDLLPGSSVAYAHLAESIQEECLPVLDRHSFPSDKLFLVEAADKGLIPNLIPRLRSIYAGISSDSTVESRSEQLPSAGAAAVVDTETDAANQGDRTSMPDFTSLLSDSQLSLPVRLALERLASNSGGENAFGGLPTPLSSANPSGYHFSRHPGQTSGQQYLPTEHSTDNTGMQGETVDDDGGAMPESMMDVLNSDVTAPLTSYRPAPYSLGPPGSNTLPGPSYSSSFRGVSVRGSKWNAQIQHEGKKIFLGTFETEVEAAKAYDQAARTFHGARALTNFDEHGNVIVAHLVHRYGVRPEHNRKSEASLARKKAAQPLPDVDKLTKRANPRRKKSTDLLSTAETLEQLSAGSLGHMLEGQPSANTYASSEGVQLNSAGTDPAAFPLESSITTPPAPVSADGHSTASMQSTERHLAKQPDTSRSQDSQRAWSTAVPTPRTSPGILPRGRSPQGSAMNFTPQALMSALSSLLAPVAAASAAWNHVPANNAHGARESPRPALHRGAGAGLYPPAQPPPGRAELLSPSFDQTKFPRQQYDGMDMLNLAVSHSSGGTDTVPAASRMRADAPADSEFGDIAVAVSGPTYGTSSAFSNSHMMLSPKLVESVRSGRPRPGDHEEMTSQAKRARMLEGDREEQV